MSLFINQIKIITYDINYNTSIESDRESLSLQQPEWIAASSCELKGSVYRLEYSSSFSALLCQIVNHLSVYLIKTQKGITYI